MGSASSGSAPPDPANRFWTDSQDGRSVSREHGPDSTLVSAMVQAWRLGERITAREILEQHPSLDAEQAVRLVYEEVCLRRDEGEALETAEVIARYPDWRDELEVLLGCDRLLRPTVFPKIGDDLGPFRLLAELGRGGSGRTFLAFEPTLADRPVVLKVTAADQGEHLALARLQHTYIVPLFSEHAFPGRGLRALCMPYLGGANLHQILDELAAIPLGDRRGRDLLYVLDRSAQEHSTRPSDDGPFRRYLEQASYVQAVCWIAACLADALHYAHARGLVHMDLKPSNVLIAGDGQPMLLDFHLARGPLGPDEPILDRLGGTPGWMSPEQEAAVEAVRSGRPIGVRIDGRSDLYALGLLLREALAGDDRDRLADHPEISVGLADIVAKCRAADPADRYPDAAALADDLRRHLSDLPLVGVPNRSLAERWRKWRRRRPGFLGRGIAWTTAFAAVVAAGLLALLAYRQQVDELRDALEDGRRLVAARRYSEAIRTLGRARDRAGRLPATERLTRAFSDQLHLARRGELADELHDLADLIRFRYGVTLPPKDEAETLSRHCRAVWDEGKSLLNPAADGPVIDSRLEQRIRTDLLDIGVVWAELRVQSAADTDAPAARTEALRLVDEAETILGPSLILRLRRRELAAGVEPSAGPDAPLPVPHSARDHYEIGRHELRLGRYADADGAFRRALEADPDDFWSHFYQGLCALRLGRFEEAVGAFRTCVALQPTAAPCHYNRGLALDALGRSDQAFGAYSRALELDPGLREASLNRGILAYKAGRPGDAIADFRRALGDGSALPDAGRVHYNLALAYLALGDRKQALESAAKAVALHERDALALHERLRAGQNTMRNDDAVNSPAVPSALRGPASAR